MRASRVPSREKEPLCTPSIARIFFSLMLLVTVLPAEVRFGKRSPFKAVTQLQVNAKRKATMTTLAMNVHQHSRCKAALLGPTQKSLGDAAMPWKPSIRPVQLLAFIVLPRPSHQE